MNPTKPGADDTARHVYPGGCGLPQRWQGRPQFTLLETGFGTGLNFLATLRAWRADPERCRRLDYVSIAAAASSASAINAADIADTGLASRYPLPLPGLHRIEFRLDGCVCVLTLAIGPVRDMLAELHLAADAVYLDGLDYQNIAVFKSIARLCRPDARAVLASATEDSRKGLVEAGFLVDEAAASGALHATYAPAWPRPVSWPDNTRRAVQDRRAIVIGAGIAGACTAHALASRGWSVTVVDAGGAPAAGASGLPAALMVPHVSPDDAPISRLTRNGAELMRGLLQLHSQPVSPGGVLQYVDDAHKARAPEAWKGQSSFELRDKPRGPARHFVNGTAIEPVPLVAALLQTAGVSVALNREVTSLVKDGADWRALDAAGNSVAQAPNVIVAASLASLRIAFGALQGGEQDREFREVLRPVKGQITVGTDPLPTGVAPLQPLSGDGHFINRWPGATGNWSWLVGASFERGDISLNATDAAHDGNLAKLGRLAPDVATATEHARTQEWVQLRCASPDRLPLAGALPSLPGVHMVAALGSRGMSLAALCAELVACQLNDEPWPVEASLARGIEPGRFV